jgi:hypothetical protein
MRHADIRTTMNIYGKVVTDEMAQANKKVARLLIPATGFTNGLQDQIAADCKATD